MKNITYIHTEGMHNEEDPRRIVPFLIDIIKPKSVVDVGCGLGSFLKVFKDLGVHDILGLDGDWVSLELLRKYIDAEKEFSKVDLGKPFSLNRKFDLAISLEVAEHIDVSSADIFVKNLTQLSDAVFFSAAIPNQGGQNHINEQNVSYWEKKFMENEFVLLDILRPVIWNDNKIFCWYKQNITLYIHKDYRLPEEILNKYSKFKIKDYVHPELYDLKVTQLNKIIYGKYSLFGYIKLLAKGVLTRFGFKIKDKPVK